MKDRCKPLLERLLMTGAAMAGIIIAMGLCNAAFAWDMSPRGVYDEPNDYWYWHRISTNNGPPLTASEVVLDEDHVYFWHTGDDYLNLRRAWGIVKGQDNPSVVLGIIDTEVDLRHPDLAGNLWVNPRESANGLDDDGNLIIDDIRGAQFLGWYWGYADPRRPFDPWQMGLDIGNNWAFVDGGGAYYGQPRYYDQRRFFSLEGDGQHGTNMLGLANQMTDNEPWWPALAPDRSAGRYPGGCGVAWNAKTVPIWMPLSVLGEPDDINLAADYIEEVVRRGTGIKVLNCSWVVSGTYPDNVPVTDMIGFFNRMRALDILVVMGAGNDNWGVQPASTVDGVLVVGAVDIAYKRALWDDCGGSSYRDVGTEGHAVDLCAYSPKGQNLINWNASGDPRDATYIVDATADDYTPFLTTGVIHLNTDESEGGGEETNGQDDEAEWILRGIIGVDSTITEPYGNGYSLPCVMPTDARTSGATAQASGVAVLLRCLYPHLTADQALGMMRRGSVNVDSYNSTMCCSDETFEDCHSGDSSTGCNGPRILGSSCAGLLGAGRLDAYRTIGLWGAVEDTAFSGDVYVIGDVAISGTCTVAPGTRFFVAPDDIVDLAAWEPETQYDMSGRRDDNHGKLPSQTAPSTKIEIKVIGTLRFNSTPESPAVFSAFVNDTPTTADWIGLTGAGTIQTPNGAGSYVTHNAGSL